MPFAAQRTTSFSRGDFATNISTIPVTSRRMSLNHFHAFRTELKASSCTSLERKQSTLRTCKTASGPQVQSSCITFRGVLAHFKLIELRNGGIRV